MLLAKQIYDLGVDLALLSSRSAPDLRDAFGSALAFGSDELIDVGRCHGVLLLAVDVGTVFGNVPSSPPLCESVWVLTLQGGACRGARCTLGRCMWP